MARVELTGWSVTGSEPQLNDKQWNMASLLGVIFVVVAILQVISFSYFKSWLSDIGLSGPTAWAVILIIAEVVAAAGFFRWRINAWGRWLSNVLAVLVTGFWFVENLRLVSDGASAQLTNSGFFGRYLPQHPGWWTVVEVSIGLFWVVYTLELAKANLGLTRRGR